MERDLDVIALLEFFDDRFDMKLARTRQDKFLGLRIAVEMQRRIFLEDPVQSAGDLVLVGPRFRFDGEGDRGLGVFDLWIDDRLCLVAQRVAGLRVL